MGKTSNMTKQRWNDNHYQQVKIYADKQTAGLFKSACGEKGVSMSDTIEEFMMAYIGAATPAKPEKDTCATRGMRRKAVQKIVSSLTTIRNAEEQYMERIPENLQGGENFTNAEESISLMDDAIDLLGQAY